ncbi:uncharacterized protein ASCRUDRAFT_75252 [Ascoidea rubescens DSM 1968]|uniref:Uncharacterized protein n=1 Tax=Ascoidea rubescens DSM 1968 TaxID=1344418 RepID=A0A1D2VK88_9ASCO|nr:hypothetical protein ASCRUDRAFT_75252 [Ascoidea rubescens DSM 1968]ODV62030.1 hypothetical protein ASCRUDRAFT_75252 [Ascoidea rubescens DSM 1968]
MIAPIASKRIAQCTARRFYSSSSGGMDPTVKKTLILSFGAVGVGLAAMLAYYPQNAPIKKFYQKSEEHAKRD